MRVAIVDHPRTTDPEHVNDVANAPLSASLNTGYASAVVERDGHEPVYFDFLSAPEPPDEMASRILVASPDWILLHWVYDWRDGAEVRALLEALRDGGFAGPIVAFGLFPTLCGRDLLALAPEMDAVLVGEFEEAIAELLSFASPPEAGLPGLLTRKSDGGHRPAIQSLEALPQPHDLGRAGALGQVNIASSRGCYGRCSFCCIQPFRGGAARWRGRSATNVLAEIETRAAARGASYAYFVDPNFFGPGDAGQKRARDLADGLKGMGLTFGLEGRVNDIRCDTIERLADAGLTSVFLGIESASPVVLARLRKGISPEMSTRAIGVLRANGVAVHAGFIMFEPDSSLDDLRLNAEFLRNNELLGDPDQTANLLGHRQIVLKGTPSYDALLAKGRLRVSADKPFEAKPVYLDSAVARVSRAMATVALHYYGLRDAHWRVRAVSELDQHQCITPGAAKRPPWNRVNDVLIETFDDLVGLAEMGAGMDEQIATARAALDTAFEKTTRLSD